MSTATIDLAREDLRWLQRFATALARDADVADDLVQDTLLQAWRSPPSGSPADGSAPSRSWLATVLRNRFRMTRRGEARRERREQASAAPREGTGPDAEHARLEVLQILLGQVRDLPDLDQKIIVRRFLEDESAVEVGRALGMSASTIRTRTQRSMTRLRESLDRRYGKRSKWCAAVLAVPIPGAGATTTHDQGSSSTMSITLKIAAATSLGALAVAGYATQRDDSAEAPSAQTTPDVAAPAPSAAQVQWDRRRAGIRQILAGEAPDETEQQDAPAAPAVKGPGYKELISECLLDAGSEQFGAVTLVLNEIAAPDIGTIYDSVVLAHTSFEDAFLNECIVEAMYAYVGPAPEEAKERQVTKTMRVGDAQTEEDRRAQVLAYIIGAHISEVRYCGTLGGEGVEGSVDFDMVLDGDKLTTATPHETDLPDAIVDCIHGATLRWKFPKTERYAFPYTFQVPVPGKNQPPRPQ